MRLTTENEEDFIFPKSTTLNEKRRIFQKAQSEHKEKAFYRSILQNYVDITVITGCYQMTKFWLLCYHLGVIVKKTLPFEGNF